MRSINSTTLQVRPSSFPEVFLLGWLTLFGIFPEDATGKTQWDVPATPVDQVQTAFGGPGAPVDQSQGPATTHSKRRVYASGQTQAYTGVGPDPSAPVLGGGGPPQQQQLFTPGFGADGFQQQQQTGYGGPSAGGQPAYAQQPHPSQLANQFGQMNLQGGTGPVGQVR